MLSPSVCKKYNLLLILLISSLLLFFYLFSPSDQNHSKSVEYDFRNIHRVKIPSDPTVQFDSVAHINTLDTSSLTDSRLEPSQTDYDQPKTPGPSLYPPTNSIDDDSSQAKLSKESRLPSAEFSTDPTSESAPYFGSTTQRNILVISTWRSGSTTFSGILSSHHDAFLHYEPLDGHYTASLTDPEVTKFVTNVTNKLLSCNYDAFDEEYLWGMYHRRAYLKENNKLPKSCKRSGKQLNPCFNQSYMSEQCRQYPVQMVKYVRVSLAQVAHYLDDYSNFKMIWLVRDPRAVWYSRQTNKMVNFWCLPGLCGDLTRLCQSYEINWNLSERLLVSNPGSFLRVKFEDLQQNPYAEAERITKFLNFENAGDIFDRIKLLDDRTNFTTKKDWKDHLNDVSRLKVESKCGDTMLKLGYM